MSIHVMESTPNTKWISFLSTISHPWDHGGVVSLVIGLIVILTILDVLTSWIISSTYVSQTFRICRNVPSFFGRASWTGLDGILNLGQNLTTNCIIYGPLYLNTDTVHHLVPFPRYSGIHFAWQSIDLSMRACTNWVLVIFGIDPWTTLSMI